MIEMEMNQMKRKVLSLAMIAALCLTMLPTAGWAADAPVEYIDFDENGVQITEPEAAISIPWLRKIIPSGMLAMKIMAGMLSAVR